jgi:hypothetical protein
MTSRRAILAALLAAPLRADDPAAEVWELLANMAAALVDGDADRFLRPFDHAMAGYEDFRALIDGLIRGWQIESSIDPVQNTGDARRRELEVDWQMHLVSRADVQQLVQRRGTVKCTFEKQGKRWMATSIAPRELFAPPSPHVNFAHQR